MALTSPGVEVTVIDQSQYLPAPTGTVPFILLATAENKADPTGTGVAAGTTPANANKLFQVTSQRDLVTLYGNPFFYTTTNGTAVQGYELNEYGLLAAYSVLGVTNRCYVLRADIDLASLVGRTGRPSSVPVNNSYWLDTTTSDWGIYEWNSTTQKFTNKQPIVIYDSADISGGYPLATIGTIGDYAVNAIQITETPSFDSPEQFFYKNDLNEWVVIGDNDWLNSWPTIQATESNPTLIPGIFTIYLSGFSNTEIEIQSNDNIYDVATYINNLGWSEISARVIDGKLNLYSSQVTVSTNSPLYVQLSSAVTGLLAAMGLDDDPHYQPTFVYGKASQMPLWGTGQTYPRPNGSVWMKVEAAGNGLVEVISKYSLARNAWVNQTVTYVNSMNSALVKLDPTGGANIPAGTLIAQYDYKTDAGTEFNNISTSPVYIKTRLTTGPTIAVGTVEDPIIGEDGTVSVLVTMPNSNTLSGPYYVAVQSGDTAQDFVNAWVAASIPNTVVQITTNGAVSITHTLGGSIVMSDATPGTIFVGSTTGSILTVTSFNSSNNTPIQLNVPIDSLGYTSGNFPTAQLTGIPGGAGTYTLDVDNGNFGPAYFSQSNAGYGVSSGILMDLGFIANSTDFVTDGGSQVFDYLLNPTVTPSGGTGAIFLMNSAFGYVSLNTIADAGTGYAVDDLLTFDGTLFGGTSPENDILFKVTNIGGGGQILDIIPVSGNVPVVPLTTISNWGPLLSPGNNAYTSNPIAPVNTPLNNTNWFYSVVDQVDIMVNTTSGWKGYRNVEYNQNGFPIPGSSFITDPNGPLVSPTEPTTQSDGTSLEYGDIWINTSDLENYPVIYRWEMVDNTDTWVLINNTDQVSSSGVLFADARWGSSGSINPVDDAIPTIKSLLQSDYIDLDAPDSNLYPVGMLLFNTRRSGYNVKQFKSNYFTLANFPEAGMYDPMDPTNINNLPQFPFTWVTASGLQSDGSPYMGRKAQRAMVVQSLRSAIDTNTDIRDEDNAFNLIATPNYPELQPNMVVLNGDRGDTGYILGDTPLGLPANATAVQAWATNAAGATSTGETGCVTRDTYMGLFYPSGLSTDLNGNTVVVPPSHMMLRTFVRNDTVAYPWLAAAGTRRGIIDNALNIGYLNRTTGEFVVTKTPLGLRDVLYTNFINPLVFFTGNGLLNYGNKTSFNSQSALDRTNVARLVAYIRRQLTVAARPFVFEPNDSLTRKQIAGVIESLMIDLVAKRGIYDYLVVCDESNNTPARIDRNELWVDVAIEPVKAAEFIYIPIRILNTGALSAAANA